MPKQTSIKGRFFVSSHGRSTIDLSDYLAGNQDAPKLKLVRLIGDHNQSAASNSHIACNDVHRIVSAIEERDPLLLCAPDIYLFGKSLWVISKTEQSYNKEQLRLVFLEALDADRSKWERLQRKFSGIAGEAVEYTREPIPQIVRIFVWRRDEGKCVQCGSNQKLEYDHILPLSKGGSNTQRNIQLLCEKCNRAKSAKI